MLVHRSSREGKMTLSKLLSTMDNASFSGHKRSLVPYMYFLMITIIKYLKSNTHFAPFT